MSNDAYASAPRLLYTINAADPAKDDEWQDGEATIPHELPCDGEHEGLIFYLVTGSARALERAFVDLGYEPVATGSKIRDVMRSWTDRWPDAVPIIAPGDPGETDLPCIGPMKAENVCRWTGKLHEPHELEEAGLTILGRFTGPHPAREDGSAVPAREDA